MAAIPVARIMTRIAYTFTPDEQARTLNAWLKADDRPAPVDKITAPLVCIAIFVGCFLIMVPQLADNGPGHGRLVSALTGIATASVTSGLGWYVIVRMRKPNAAILPRAVTIDDAALVVENGNDAIEIPWDDIFNIHINRLAIIIQTDNHLDHVIPRRVFDHGADALDFHRALVNHWKRPASMPYDVQRVDEDGVWPPPPSTDN